LVFTLPKVIEHIKDDDGKIIDVKETIIECPAKPAEEPIFEFINQKAKLSNLKQSLLSKLREDRIERFNEEQVELQAAAENDENYYLNQMDENEKQMEELLKREEEMDVIDAVF